MADLTDLEAALSSLGPRSAWIRALVERRDDAAVEGRHSEAAVWHALMVVLVDLRDEESATLRALDDATPWGRVALPDPGAGSVESEAGE